VQELRLLGLFFLGGMAVVQLRHAGGFALALQFVLWAISGLALLEIAWQLGGLRRRGSLAVVWLLFAAGYGYLGYLQTCSHGVACDSPGMNYLARLYLPYAVIGAIVFGVAILSVALLRWRGVRSRWPAFALGAAAVVASRGLAEWLLDLWR
jgi:hypothetical protein